MRSEEEIKEQLEILKEISIIVHPSLLTFCEWVLEIGDEKKQKVVLEIWKGIYDAHLRNKK